MTGLHLIRKRRKAGDRWYVYAFRGGPCILITDGRKPDITPALLEKAIDARRTPSCKGDIKWLAREYAISAEFKALRPQTRRDYERSLDRIEARFGPAPLGAFEDRRIRNDIIQWRDAWRAQPRTADKVLVMLQTLLSWAVERGHLAINAAHGIKQIHKADRSDLIWDAAHWAAWHSANIPAQLQRAVAIKSRTGLRLGDLVLLDWEHVHDKVIVLKTKKRGGVATVPIFDDLRDCLNSIKPVETLRKGPVLVNSRGKRWTESGLGSVFQKNKPANFNRTMHDLRGTFVTWLAIKGLTDEEIARVIGWKARRIADIRARYVDEARVVTSLVERLRA